jgi:hypothetical protein
MVQYFRHELCTISLSMMFRFGKLRKLTSVLAFVCALAVANASCATCPTCDQLLRPNAHSGLGTSSATTDRDCGCNGCCSCCVIPLVGPAFVSLASAVEVFPAVTVRVLGLRGWATPIYLPPRN